MNLRDASVEMRELPTSAIDPPELPARAEMDEVKLEELTASIKAHGVLQPISVVQVGVRYEVVAGHRRTVAALRAGAATIRAVVYPTKTLALEAVKWAENRFREEMSVTEEAVYFAQLLETECGNDTNRLSQLLGEKRAYVEGRLLLFQGAPEVLNALAKRHITIGVAHELNKCSEKLMRDYYLGNAIRDGASVAVVTGWIQQWKNSLGPSGVLPGPVVGVSARGPIAETNYFVCIACGESNDVHLMQPVNLHTHCRKAVIEKALAFYTRRHELLAWPRTQDEAAAVVNQILERFPQLGAA